MEHPIIGASRATSSKLMGLKPLRFELSVEAGIPLLFTMASILIPLSLIASSRRLAASVLTC